jgi:hypothetical protein
LLESSVLALNENLKKLGRFVGALSLRPYLSNPSVLGRRLLVKDEDLIISHALLCDDDLLTPVDNEVSSLVILAVFSSTNSVILTQAVELAELRPEHHRDLANHHSGRSILSKYLLYLSLAESSLGVHLILVSVKLLFRKSDVNEELSGISEVAHACLMWIDSTILVIFLSDTRALVDTCLAKLYLPDDEFVCILRGLVCKSESTKYLLTRY